MWTTVTGELLPAEGEGEGLDPRQTLRSVVRIEGLAHPQELQAQRPGTRASQHVDALTWSLRATPLRTTGYRLARPGTAGGDREHIVAK